MSAANETRKPAPKKRGNKKRRVEVEEDEATVVEENKGESQYRGIKDVVQLMKQLQADFQKERQELKVLNKALRDERSPQAWT